MHADSTCDLTKNSISLYLFHLQSSFYDFLTKNSWNQPSLAVNWLHEIFSYYVIAQCGNSGNSLSHFFDKNFVKPTVLLNKLLKSWFHEIFFQWERIFEISTVWKLRKFSLTEEIFREINSLVTYLVKPLVSRNFYYLRKRESNGNFQNFSLQYRSVVWKLRNFIATFPWNQLFAKELYSKLIWRKKIAWQKNSRFSTLWINHSVMVCVAIMDILSH